MCKHTGEPTSRAARVKKSPRHSVNVHALRIPTDRRPLLQAGKAAVMSDDLQETIRESAKAPAKASGDAGSVEQHKLTEQIAADKYLASKVAASQRSVAFALTSSFRRVRTDRSRRIEFVLIGRGVGFNSRIESGMLKLLSGILSKGSDRKDRSLIRGRSARHPFSLVRCLAL